MTLRRADHGNAIGLPLARALCDAALACQSDQSVRAVLLSGEGRSFCVGGDLREFSTVEPDRRADHLLEVTDALHAALRSLAAGNAPVIAAVQGAAAGAGVSLAAVADVSVAASDARFLLAYTAIDYSPDGWRDLVAAAPGREQARVGVAAAQPAASMWARGVRPVELIGAVSARWWGRGWATSAAR